MPTSRAESIARRDRVSRRAVATVPPNVASGYAETDPAIQHLQSWRGDELAAEASFCLAGQLALGLTEEQVRAYSNQPAG
jgi:hypothetical protein